MLTGRARQVRNHLRGRGRWQMAMGALLFVCFFVLAGSTLAAAFLRLRDLGLEASAGPLLAVVLGGVLIGVLVFDLQYTVSGVLLDSDLDFLRGGPISAWQLVTLKGLDSLPRTTALLAAVGLPACLAFGVIMGLPPWGWMLVPVVLAGLWAAPLGVGFAAALLVLRLVPARRVGEALAVFSTLVMLVIWLLNSFAMPRWLGDEGTSGPHLLQRLAPAPWVEMWSPAHWAANALGAAHRMAFFDALGWTSRLILGGVVSLAVGGLAARRLLDDVLARAVSGQAERARRRVRPSGAPASGLTALLLKDARLFTRDWAVLGDVLTAALLWTLLPLVAAPLYEAPPSLVARFMLTALAVGLGYEVGARTVPYEGPALAWSHLAPLPMWRWNLAKWIGGFLVSLPLVLIAASAVQVAYALETLALLEVVAAAVSALVVALVLGLWTGWTFGNPAWTNPRAMLTWPGRLLASALLLAQAGMWLLALALLDERRPWLPPGILLWAPLLLAALASLPAFALVVRVARQHEWSGE